MCSLALQHSEGAPTPALILRSKASPRGNEAPGAGATVPCDPRGTEASLKARLEQFLFAFNEEKVDLGNPQSSPRH